MVVGDAGECSACIAGHRLHQERCVCRVHLRDLSSMELSGRRRHHLGHKGSSKPLRRESMLLETAVETRVDASRDCF